MPPILQRQLPYSQWMTQARRLNPGLSDDQLQAHWTKRYGQPAPATEDTGDFMRGFEATGRGLGQQVTGIGVGAAETGEYLFGSGGHLTRLKEGLLDSYRAQGRELAKLHKPTDNVDIAFEQAMEGNVGGFVDFLQYGLGRGAGEAITALGTFGIGGLVGRALFRKIGAGFIEREAVRLTAKKKMPAGKLVSEATKNVAQKFARAGQWGAVYGMGTGREYGEIMGDLVGRSVRERRYLTGSELAKGGASALAAGWLEFGVDRYGINLLLGKKGLSDRLKQMTGFGGRAARGGALAGRLGVAEGATEFPQTLLEEYGKGEDPFSEESILQAWRASALGFVGGAGVGGARGTATGPSTPPTKKTAPNESILGAETIDDAIDAADRALSGRKAAPTEQVDLASIEKAIEAEFAKFQPDPVEVERERLETLKRQRLQDEQDRIRAMQRVTSDQPSADVTPDQTLDPTQVPRDQLPLEDDAMMLARAQQAKDDLDMAGQDRGGKVFLEQEGKGGPPEVIGWKSPTPEWFKEATHGAGKLSLKRVQVALEKIIMNKGRDVGKDVERVKELLLQDHAFMDSPMAPKTDEEWAYMIAAVQAERRGADPYDPAQLEPYLAATSPENDLPQPTQAQKEAGNYRKGHVKVAGLNISIENPEGSERSGVDPDGNPWSVTMKSHYGYIRGTEGADEEQVDVFIRPGTPEDYDGPVWVINQEDPKSRAFDEHKALLGYPDKDAAIQGYFENYTEDWDGAGSIAEFPTMASFKDWLARGDKTRAVGELDDSEDVVGEQPGTYAVGGLAGGPVFLKSVQVIQEKMANKATGREVMALLRNAGIKDEEMEQTTLYDYLAFHSDDQVNKTELLDLLSKHHPARKFSLKPAPHLDESTYSEYTLPGGQNYMEWLLVYENPEEAEMYISPHFPMSSNVMAHIRTKDRKGPNDEKILFIEEMQSDWHAQGRRHGYGFESPVSRVPDAPFKKTWHEFALKQILFNAVALGYDAIGWTTGEQQVERYDLRKVVNELEYQKIQGEEAWYLVGRNDSGGVVVNQRVTSEKQLVELVGKEVADRIIKGVGERAYPENVAVQSLKTAKKLTGENLAIGGRWAERLYDKVIPSFLKKYTKQWGTAPTLANLGSKDYSTAIEYVHTEYGWKLDVPQRMHDLAKEQLGVDLTEPVREEDLQTFFGDWIASRMIASAPGFEAGWKSISTYTDQVTGTFKVLFEDFDKFHKAHNENRGRIGQIHFLPIPDAMRKDIAEGQSMFQPRSKYDPDQMRLQFAVKPPTTWQGKDVEQDDLFGGGALPPDPSQVRQAPGGRTIAQELRQELNRDQALDLRGHTVRHAQDLGELAQIYRNPHYETLRVFYVKDDKIIAHEGITSRLPTAARAFADPVRFAERQRHRMRRLGADGYYLLHNHPSGHPKPSYQDYSVTHKIEDMVPGFRGHVVIDHTKFSVIPPNSDFEQVTEYPVSNDDLRAGARPLDHPLIGESITGPVTLMRLAMQLNQTPDMATVIYTTHPTGNYNQVTAIQELPYGFMQSRDAGAYLRKSMNAFGASDVFAVATTPERKGHQALQTMFLKRQLRDVLTIDQEGRWDSLAERVTADPKYTLGLTELPNHHVREQQGLYGETPDQEGLGPPTDGPQLEMYTDPANPNYRVSEPTPQDGVIRTLQDQFVDIRRHVEAIQRAGHKIKDELNPVFKEEVYQQKVALATREYLNDELKPLLEEMQTHNVAVKDLDAYLQARHVVTDNLNERLQAMNPKRADNEALSGMTTEEAQRIVTDTPTRVKQLAARVDAMTQKTRHLMVEYGLETQETIDTWETRYHAYVPLKREGFDDAPGTGQGRSIRGSQVKRRLGSTRTVSPILANIAMERDKTIIRGEKMKPVIALAGLMTEFPDRQLASLAKVTPITITDPETGLEQQVVAKVGNYTVPMIKRVNKDGVVESVPNPNYQGLPNVVNFRIKGKQYAIVFNPHNARAREMARALKDMDTDHLNKFLRAAYPVTRWMAGVNTQYNPIFGVVNFVRDVGFAMLTLTNTDLNGKQGDILKATLKHMAGIYTEARAVRRGEHSDSETSQLWRRFERAGGPTGYRDLFGGTEDRATAIEKMLSPNAFEKGWKGVGGEAVMGWLSDFNLMAENAIRLGVFRTALNQGMSDLKAASLAKNVTVNFNRKGTFTNQMGALYAFFNASVQGTMRMAETLFQIKDGKITGWTKYGKQIVSGGALVGALQTMWLAMAGFEEDDLPEWVLARNLVIPLPGDKKDYLSIPMPLGFNVLTNLGRAAMETVLYGQPIKQAWQVLGDMIDVFSPVGGTASVLQFGAPTFADPLVAVMENRTWTGDPVYRENVSSVDPTPGHARSRGVAPFWAEAMSRAVNYATGGTKHRPGWASPTPDAINYLIGQFLGGAGRETAKASRVLETMRTGEDLPAHKIPLLGRFKGRATGHHATRSQYYDVITELHGLKREIKGLVTEGKPTAPLYKSEPLARYAFAGVKLHNKVKKLQQARKKLMERHGYTESVKLLDQSIERLMQHILERARVYEGKKAA